MKSYRDLEIYPMSYRLALKVHKVSISIPKYELYEQGSQIRRSSKSVKDNIIKDYGRKRYKQEFIQYAETNRKTQNLSTSNL